MRRAIAIWTLSLALIWLGSECVARSQSPQLDLLLWQKQQTNTPRLLLDTLSTPAIGAWSSRKLRSGYGGGPYHVRDFNNVISAEAAFLPTGELDQTSITAPFGTTAALVDAWHNQAGGFSDLSQGNRDGMPVLWSGTAFTLINGKVVVPFVALNNEFLAGAPTLDQAQPWTIAICMMHNAGGGALISDGLNATNWSVSPGTTAYSVLFGGSFRGNFGTTDTTTTHGLFFIGDSAHINSQLIVDGVVIGGPANWGTNGILHANGLDLAADPGGDLASVTVAEIIIFNGVLSASDQAAIINSWVSAFAIP